jgi:hypothetical protein
MRTASGSAISSMASEMTSAHTGSICTRSTGQPVQIIEETNIRQARITADYSRLFVTLRQRPHGPRRAGATDGRRWPLPILHRSLFDVV